MRTLQTGWGLSAAVSWPFSHEANFTSPVSNVSRHWTSPLRCRFFESGLDLFDGGDECSDRLRATVAFLLHNC